MNLEGLTEKRNRMGTVYYENTFGDIIAKVCRNCNITHTLDDYGVKVGGLGGRASACRRCEKTKRKQYYRKNVEKAKKWREENKAYISAYNKNYYEIKKEKICDRQKGYYQSNKTKVKNYINEWQSINQYKVKAYKDKWQKENPEKRAINELRRRARKAYLPDTITEDEYALTLDYFANACALTGETQNLEKEHAIPLSIGHGGTTFENCYPMANGLNQSKGSHNIFEWFEANRQRFKLEQKRFDRLIEWLGKANGMTVEEYRDYVYWCHANPREIDEYDERKAL